MKNDNFNQVILSGHLVADAQVKKPDFIIASLATNYDFWFNEKNQQYKNRVVYNKLIFGNDKNLAEQASDLKRGQEIAIEGKLQKNDWQDKNGVKHYSVDVVVTKLTLPTKEMEEENTQANATE